MDNFFGELKRRKVYRVAAAYVVAAGFIIQIASAVLPAWELPPWSQRLVITLVLAGFPIALIFAWIFDLTASGIERTPTRTETVATIPRRRRNVILLGITGLLLSIAAGFFILPHASARKVEKSIAILPFENFSDDKANAYFADGIQDDVLTNLAKIGDLKVISRTSVMQYRGQQHNLREIGKALGVSAILEGSVRRTGNRVRVNVQLIDAEHDRHMWAEDYDRDLTDVFAIQSDLAQKIAQELQAQLSPNEKEQLTRKPTQNGEAYLAFVQARNLFVPEDQEKILQGVQLYERALQLDPNFALAAAGLSRLESWIYHSFEPTTARRDRARALAERALQLQPDLPEGHLALGFSYYYGDSNFEAAEKEFAIAKKSLPNDSEVYLAMGAIERRQGRWAESTANLSKAAELNPNASWPLQNLAFNYQMQRDYASANKIIDRALKIDPDNFGLLAIRAKFALADKGDLSVGQRALEEMEKLPPSAAKTEAMVIGKVGLLLFQRNFREALRVSESLPDDQLASKSGLLCGKYLYIGIARYCLKDEPSARAALMRAKEYAEARVRDTPNTPDAHIQLGYVHAYLGEKAEAIAEADRAMQLLPETKDAFNGPDITEFAAKILVAAGEKDRAIELISGLLKRPAALTVELLKLDPEWDALRNDPRFQALIGQSPS
jgi:TolB-like protein/cytochrome c-type biogenesis protein CcmH/NrfG